MLFSILRLLKISMSFDAMTTSPVESMNSSLKRETGINKNSNTRYANVWIMFEFMNMFLMCKHKKVTHYHNSNTLMKLAKGNKHQILAFENEANRQLQFSSLSSILVVRDKIVQKCLYMGNQNFDRWKYFHCVAQSDDIWMV